MVRKVLFVCGILSSLFYVGADIFAAMQWDGYSYTDQAFRELTAIAAGLSTPWFGVKERINIYASMLWVLVFAITLLRVHDTIAPVQQGKPAVIPQVGGTTSAAGQP